MAAKPFLYSITDSVLFARLVSDPEIQFRPHSGLHQGERF